MLRPECQRHNMTRGCTMQQLHSTKILHRGCKTARGAYHQRIMSIGTTPKAYPGRLAVGPRADGGVGGQLSDAVRQLSPNALQRALVRLVACVAGIYLHRQEAELPGHHSIRQVCQYNPEGTTQRMLVELNNRPTYIATSSIARSMQKEWVWTMSHPLMASANMP